MAKFPPLHKDPSRLTELPEADYKEVKYLLTTCTYRLDPLYCNHIAANMYIKRRNFSFIAGVNLLRSLIYSLFINADYPDGYMATGHVDVPSEPDPENPYRRSGKISVVFEIRFNKRTGQKEIMLITGWSEFDTV